MLLTFRVANHRSLRDEQELSLVTPLASSSGSPPGSGDTELRSPPPHVTTLAGIYGANASGKSNVLDALHFMRRVVCDSYQSWKPGEGIANEAFLLDGKYRAAPSFFEVDIMVAGVRYTYGFYLDAKRIVKEWLYAYPHGRRQIWYERDSDADEKYYFGKNLGGRNRTIADLTRPNSLYLSAAAANNHERLYVVYHWFLHHLRMAGPANRGLRTKYTLARLEDDDGKSRILDLLKAADLGIKEILVRQETEKSPPTPAAASSSVGTESSDHRDVGTPEYNARQVVEFEHEAEAEAGAKPIPLAHESLGTRAWFALLGPVIRVLDYGDTLLVDELDASLHPTLSSRVLQMFRDPELNRRGAQLIFTTHDTSLLGNLVGDAALKREDVWFTEKDAKGATTLFPLTDFSPRKLENLERGYLQGRYGAVPFVDDEYVRQGATGARDVTGDCEE